MQLERITVSELSQFLTDSICFHIDMYNYVCVHDMTIEVKLSWGTKRIGRAGVKRKKKRKRRKSMLNV